MSLDQRVTEDLRLIVLQLLANGGETNLRIVHSAMTDFGHNPSMDKLRGDVAWLEEQGLLTSRAAGSTLVVAATQRGEDVARGRAEVPGVRRPRPHELA